MLNLKVKKLHPDARLPAYGRPGDAGLDLTAISMHMEGENGMLVYRTGLAIEIPAGHVGLLFPRSSVSKYDLNLANSVGVIDENYRGEVVVKFRRTSGNTCQVYDKNDRVIQLVILPYPEVAIQEVASLSDSNRGAAGFGSSGR